MSKDAYAVSAPVYDLLIASFRPGQVAALKRLIPLVRAESGPVLDIGAGSGLNTVFVLERLPEARVYALEPSTAMRALVLTKVAAHPEWFDRVTIRPEAFGAAPLCLTPSARRSCWASSATSARMNGPHCSPPSPPGSPRAGPP